MSTFFEKLSKNIASLKIEKFKKPKFGVKTVLK